MPGREYVEQENERLLRLLALTAYRNEQADLAEFAASPECVPPTPEQKQSFMDFIDRKIEEARKRKRKQYFIKVARRAACIVFIAAALTTTAYMANKQRMGFITKDHHNYSDLQGSVDELQDCPDGWESEYYPTWMPEGFVLTGTTATDETQTAYYRKDKRTILFIVFDRIVDYSTVGLDTEGMEKRPFVINNEECEIYSTSDSQQSTFSFRQNDITIAVLGDLSPNDVVRIVENIHIPN